jgi:hypothetical protein
MKILVGYQHPTRRQACPYLCDGRKRQQKQNADFLQRVSFPTSLLFFFHLA